MAIALKFGSWLCAVVLIFTALVWLVGGFLVTSKQAAGGTLPGLELVPQLFWPVRAIISALSVVGAVILVLSRPAFLRVLSVWFVAELALLGWLYATGFLSSSFDNFDTIRNMAMWQGLNLAVVMFAWVKYRTVYRTAIHRE